MTLPTLAFAATEPEQVGLQYDANVNPRSGALCVSIPLRLSQGRSGFGPELALTYDSSGQSSPFGVGWTLSGMLAVSRSTRKGVPKYDETDTLLFAGTELVPMLRAGSPRRDETNDYRISYFRAAADKSRIRIERWEHKTTGRVHFRTRDRENTLTTYGLREDGSSQIGDATGERTFTYLPDAQYQPTGNAIVFEYAAEDARGIDQSAPYETGRDSSAERYLKRIRYGNTVPLAPDAAPPSEITWLFEVVFDYGDHGDPATVDPSREWAARVDPFSSYRAGFEIRTHRLCNRVLMFHRFAELGDAPLLVGAHHLEYLPAEAGTVLSKVHYSGFRTDAGALTERALPPIELQYSEPSVTTEFDAPPGDALANVPHGLSGRDYRFIDLYGEGLSGILTETPDAWYYKSNLGDGHFDEQQVVVERPAYRLGSCAISDFDGDGNLNLAVLEGRSGGYYEFDRETEAWSGFHPFDALPHLEAAGARAQWLDVDGDGRADLLLSTPDAVTWFPSLGKGGFGEGQVVQRRGDSASIGESVALRTFFADMTGDGLADQVRVRNGCVEYWPNLGRGDFGPPIAMEGAPVFDHNFDPRRLLLADLDGTGGADVLYVGTGELVYWLNAGGNSLIPGGRITGLPYIDQVSSLRILDFFGDGTSCLVWSSPLESRANPIQCLPLTNRIRPRLLVSINDSMGQSTTIAYSSSASHYLRDKRRGRPWRTKLPSHAVVVDLLETRDLIGGTSVVSRFEYHDGFFDSDDRLFRGFCLVDRYDTPKVPDAMTGDPLSALTQPSCSRTWFHSGTATRGAPPEAYSGDSNQALVPPHTFENLGDLGPDDFDVGLRALAGQVVRVEHFAAAFTGERALAPFEVTQYGYRLRMLQPASREFDAAFDYFQSEELAYQYEQKGDDPRITHNLDLSFDAYGSVQTSVSLAYPRRGTVVHSSQAVSVVSGRTMRAVHSDEREKYLLGVGYEQSDLEIVGLPASAVLSWGDVVALVSGPIASPLDHGAPFTTGIQARRLSWERSYFWDDAESAQLPLGDVGAFAYTHHVEGAVFTPAYVTEVYGGRVTPTMLTGDGRYALHDGYYWDPGTIHHYTPAFRQLCQIERGDGSSYFDYDAYDLAVIQLRDAALNATRGDIDYQVLAAKRIVDPNGNVAEVLYDPLGVVIASTAYGQAMDKAGGAQAYGHEPLASYVPRGAATFAELIATPELYVQGAGQYIDYDLSASPPRVVKLVREQFVHDGEGGSAPNGRIQIAVTYLDGFREPLQSKLLAEPGPAILRDASGSLILNASGVPEAGDVAARWLCAGHKVRNAKLEVVREYEPFFSSTPLYEPEQQLASWGRSREVSHDAAGRVVEEAFPNGTFSRVEYAAWSMTRYDANDTVLDSTYRAVRLGLDDSNPEKQAMRKAEAHANTPVSIAFDPRGVAMMQTEVAPQGDRVSVSTLDGRGKAVAHTDARGLKAFEYNLDMEGRVLQTRSADAGESFTLYDVFGREIHLWDGRGVHQSRTFDPLDRPLTVAIHDGVSGPHVREQFIYGEDPSVPDKELRNARGRLFMHRDPAGIIAFQRYDFGGLIRETTRQLRVDYKSDPDWNDPSTTVLEPDVYRTMSAYDTLGRPVTQWMPDGTTRTFEHLRAGGLTTISLSSEDGSIAAMKILDGANYNARGQRISAHLGNGVDLSFTYDADTFRTSHAGAMRGPTVLQDLRYTYDPVGNLTFALDGAEEPVASGPFLRGLNVSSAQDFSYDPFYQLTSATGRVHGALLEGDYRPFAASTVAGTRRLSLSDGSLVERYTRNYSYDLAGNLAQIRHQGASQSWTTTLWVSPKSNRSLPATAPDGTPVQDPESRFDACGNSNFLPHLRRIDWNTRGSLSLAVLIDRSGTGQPDDAEYYVYDGQGLRVRKVSERLVAGNVETTEKIYLDGCEIKRIKSGATPILQRKTAHLSDGISRLAVVHVWTLDTAARESSDVTRARIRYRLSNHLGSASLDLDEAGGVISYEEYFPFGGTSFVACDSDRDVELKDYRFCNKERDDATGLYYFEHRYYASWFARFVSPDPIGPEDDFNLYRYCGNNPVNFTDPDGTDARAIPYRYVPFESLPSQYQTDANRGTQFFILYAPAQAGGPQPVFREFSNAAEMEAEARRHKGAFVGVYDPRYQRHLEEAQARGMPEATAQSLAEMLTTIDAAFDSAPESFRTPSSGGGGGAAAGDAPQGSPPGTPGGGGGDGREGGAQGASGDPAGATPKGNPPAPHSADGSSESSTPGGAGTGGAGDGRGSGRAGDGRGGGGVAAASAGQGDAAAGAGSGSGSRGAGTGRRNGAAARALRENEGAENGVPGGVASDSATGFAKGTSSGSGGNATGAAQASPNGSPSGIPGGSESGLPGGAPGGTMPPAPGQTVNGDDPNGTTTGSPHGASLGRSRTPAGDDGQGGTRGTNPSGTGHGQGAGGGHDSSGSGSGQQRTVMDRVAHIAGYLNLEFGDGDPKGVSGGIPGGKGTHNLGGWGQALYASLAVIGVALMFLGGGGIKAAFQGVAKLFTRAFWREVGTSIAGWWARHTVEIALGRGAIRFFPVHAAWRTAVSEWTHAGGGKVLYYLSRPFATRAEVAAGQLTWREVFSLQRVTTEGAAGWVARRQWFTVKLPALLPRLAETPAGRPVMSCVSAAWNAWSRSNFHIPNLAIGGGAGYGIYRLFFGGHDAPTPPPAQTAEPVRAH